MIVTLEEYCRMVPSAAALPGEQVTPLLQGASTAAERYCNRTFHKSIAATEYYDLPPPGGRNEIPLKRQPVTVVSGVKVDPRGGFGQLTDSFGSTTALTSGTDYYCDYTTGMLHILTMRGSWPLFGSFGVGSNYGYPFGSNARNARTGTVQVTYTAGYSDYPADLKLAVAQIASWLSGVGMESGGRDVTSYIDVSVGSQAAIDALGFGAVPALGTSRDILNRYRETPVVSAGRW